MEFPKQLLRREQSNRIQGKGPMSVACPPHRVKQAGYGLDTIGTRIAYEKMQSGLIFGGLRALSWLIFLPRIAFSAC